MRKGGTIIVVDDSPPDRELILHCLRDAGVEAPVHLLASGADALAYLKGEPPYQNRDTFQYPALIITDLKMPGIDGLALLEFLRGHPELAVVPTVVLSGSADLDDIEIAYSLGASSYIVKPPTAAELCDRMRALIEFWCVCEAPHSARTGLHLRSEARGKIGDRYSRSPFPPAGPDPGAGL